MPGMLLNARGIMDQEQIVKVLLAGPLYALAVLQIFGPHRLWSRDSFKIFLWGMLFAVAAPPVLMVAGAIPIAKPGPEPVLERVWQMAFIWLMLFALAAVGRLGVLIARYVWRRRPRPQPLTPPSPEPSPSQPSPAPPLEGDRSGLHH